MSKRPVCYVPPSPEVLGHFAYDVCRGLGPDYCAHEVVQGFASFMKVVARATAKDLNRKHATEFDSGIE